jgi:beta-hydroxylase
MKWLIIGIYVFSFICIHRRGKLCLPLRQQLFSQSTLFAPINVFMYLFSRGAATPFVPPAEVPGIGRLRENWQAIRAEAENLQALPGFYLKWYDSVLPAAQHLCPRTSALLRSIPAIKFASFVEMRPGARLKRHRDPYAGWLRYHLSLSTPNDEACFIEVDGQRYAWRDGHAMLFDETYVHWADNGCDTSRLILLCDIERPMRFRWAQAVNHFFGRMLSAAMNSPGGATSQKGLAAVLFGVPRSIGRYRRRLRSWSMASYRVTVAALIAGIAVLLALY